ncbi:MAG: hypothetical protein ABJC39_05910 [Chloroflexota bacterium]
MTGRGPLDAQPGHSLPVFDRIAPAPPPAVVAAKVELHTGPGDVVADLFGRGGWVARAAVDRQRKVVSLESGPLERMLADVVLRPPDVRHLDAAFQALAASPRRESSLKVWIGDLFATRCATCSRTLVIDEVIWSVEDDAGIAGRARPLRRHYRCTVCRDQLGGAEQRQAPLDADDLRRATADVGAEAMRASLIARFPEVAGAEGLPDELLDLHTDRQLVGLGAILERIEGDLRAAPLLAALRLILLHAILPASRLAGPPGRVGSLRVSSGHVRPQAGTQFRERNPWLTFEDAFRTVRGFIQRLEGGSAGPIQARLGEDLRSLGEGSATTVIALGGPGATGLLEDDPHAYGRTAPTPRIRLIVSQPPVRPSLERLAAAYHGTSWVLGREGAALLPIDALAAGSLRTPWGWQANAVARGLEAVEPSLARDGRVVLIVDGGPEAVVAAVLGGATAGYRLLSARLSDADDDAAAIVDLLPPRGKLPPGARTRANVGLDPVAGGAGDPDIVPSTRLFAPPERFDDRSFSSADTARTVTEVAVETLRARGEPARYERLLGEILVGLDRAGQPRRLAAATLAGDVPDDRDRATTGEPDRATGSAGAGDADAGSAGAGDADASGSWTPIADADADADPDEAATESEPPPATTRGRRVADREPPADPVERLLGIIRDELGRPSQRRVTEIEPGRWWLADTEDLDGAAVSLADRVEWAVFSLLSTSGPMSESAFLERIGALFLGQDTPDERLVRACLDSYRSLASTPQRLITGDDLLGRSQEHTELLAAIARGGHQLGMRVWIGRREQTRRHGEGTLGDLLDDAEQRAYLGGISPATDDLTEVDVVWYVRGKVAFLFEVEWTAMLGEPLLRRHARIPPDDALIRFLVVAPERTELVRYKLARSPLLRTAFEECNWHIIKAPHFETFLARDPLDLADLEPFLGLDPPVERSMGEQMPLFGGVPDGS